MYIALIIFILIVVVSVFFLLYAYRVTFFVSKKQKNSPMELPSGEQYDKISGRANELINEMESIPYEPVSITSSDGLMLFGRYYHVTDGAPVHIQFHGYRATGTRDFCSGNKIIREAGHNSLIVDQRSSGKSDGRSITFGILERNDAKLWAEYVYNRFGRNTKIFLSGVSMGASTVLMASAFDMPGVVGIIADCPYSSPLDIIRKVSAEIGFPPALSMPFIRASARLLGGFQLTDIQIPEEVKKSRYPILILHGEDDRFVPCDMSRRIHQANPDIIQLEIFPNAGHALSCMEDTPRYERVSRTFIENCLQK